MKVYKPAEVLVSVEHLLVKRHVACGCCRRAEGRYGRVTGEIE